MKYINRVFYEYIEDRMIVAQMSNEFISFGAIVKLKTPYTSTVENCIYLGDLWKPIKKLIRF